MKLNKKGFTLIELLAVVVILLAISVMAVSSISAAIERNKAKQDNAKLEILKSYAKLYIEEHGKGNCSDEQGTGVYVENLKEKYSLDEKDDLTKSNGKSFEDKDCIIP